MNSSCVDGNYDESENDEMMTVWIARQSLGL